MICVPVCVRVWVIVTFGPAHPFGVHQQFDCWIIHGISYWLLIRNIYIRPLPRHRNIDYKRNLLPLCGQRFPRVYDEQYYVRSVLATCDVWDKGVFTHVLHASTIHRHRELPWWLRITRTTSNIIGHGCASNIQHSALDAVCVCVCVAMGQFCSWPNTIFSSMFVVALRHSPLVTCSPRACGM